MEHSLERESELKTGAAQLETGFQVVWQIRDFRLLWLGEGVSVLGDHFYMVALPWLVLQLTGDALAMGTVLALAAIPRALFMLIGGALTDRFSPRTLMLGSNLVRFMLVAWLTILVVTGMVQMWMVYLLALCFGLADAFFYPAQSSITPRLVRPEQLQTANAMVQGTMQLAMLAGPVLAGVLIAALDRNQGEANNLDKTGIGLALGFDALTFLVSLFTLWLMHPLPAAATIQHETVWSSIRTGLAHVASDATLKTFFLIVAAFTFLINGPFNVGVPVLANSQWAEGAAAFGLILSAFGGGALLGMVLAGTLPRPTGRRMGPTLLVITGFMGIGLALLGSVASTVAAAGIALVMGGANGYVNVLFVTWLQGRTPPALLGRMMSLLMFAMTGLFPVSVALSGVISRSSATGLLVGAGIILVGLVLLMVLFNPAVRKMGNENA